MKRTPLQRKTPLAVRTPLARSSLPLRRAPLVQRRPKPAVTSKVRELLKRRSEGTCEIYMPAVCTRSATDAAHRIPRAIGGRHGAAEVESARLSNLLHACRACHEWCHENPIGAAGRGWVLSSVCRLDPATKRVWLSGERWVLLDDEGGWTPCA